MQEKHDILKQYYFDIQNPSAYGGAEQLYRVLKGKYPGQFSRTYIRKWLQGVDSYSVLKQVRRKFKTPNVRVTFINEQFDADLTSVQNISKDNDGINYLLFVIDIFSRFLSVEPLKNKTAKSILYAVKKVFRQQKPLKFRTDKGSEFVNKDLKKFMKDKNVYFFTTQNLPKANFKERAQKSFKVKLFRFLRKKRNYPFIDDLQKIVANYNATSHRSLNFTAPKDVTKANEADLWAFMYLKKPSSKQKKPRFQFNLGDLVRISY